MKNKSELRSQCPVNYALEYLGDKWTLLVVRDLVFEGKKYYKEFLQSAEGIATNILSDRLKKLEAAGVISSAKDPNLKTQKVYSLTEKGMDLIPLLIEAMIWSATHKDGLNIPTNFVEELKNNKEAVIKQINAAVGTTAFSANG